MLTTHTHPRRGFITSSLSLMLYYHLLLHSIIYDIHSIYVHVPFFMFHRMPLFFWSKWETRLLPLVSDLLSWLQTVEMIRILKKRQNAVGNMLVRKFSFAPIKEKTQLFKSYCSPIFGCVLCRHSFQDSIRKLTVSYSETLTHLINVPRYTSSSLAFAMNATDHINVVSSKFA